MAKNEAVAEIIHGFTKKPRIVFIAYTGDAKKYIKNFERYSLKNIDFLNIGKGTLDKNLSDYTIVILFGGNPSIIKKQIVEVQLDTRIDHENTLVVTTSGSTCVFSGSFALLNSLYPAWKNRDTEGLKYFPDEILPHFQRYKNKRTEIERYALNHKVYALPDRTAISYIRNKIELIGEVKVL